MATSRPQGSFKVELGETFNNNSSKSFHTLRYNFKPSSVAWSQHGRLKVNGRGVELQIDGEWRSLSSPGFSCLPVCGELGPVECILGDGVHISYEEARSCERTARQGMKGARAADYACTPHAGPRH